MTYHIIFEPDYQRLLNAIIIDNRALIPEIKNQTGYVIKDYIDKQLALIDNTCISYKVETDVGALAAFFTIKVNTSNKTATLIIKYLRPAFQEFTQEISQLIINFIQSNNWERDYIF